MKTQQLARTPDTGIARQTEAPFRWYGASQRLGLDQGLSAEQMAVLRLVAIGCDEPIIARALQLAPGRAHRMIEDMCRDAGVRTRAHLVTRALLVGYLNLAELRVVDAERWPSALEAAVEGTG